jgi:hypothetical protein
MRCLDFILFLDFCMLCLMILMLQQVRFDVEVTYFGCLGA